MDGVALTPQQCIRRFQRTADRRAITHQNHYRYTDGRQETTTFGPYTPATTPAVFLEASFSLGSPAVADATPFAFETGFRDGERRVSLVARRDAHGVWQPSVVITEHLGRFAERPPDDHPRPAGLPRGTNRVVPARGDGRGPADGARAGRAGGQPAPPPRPWAAVGGHCGVGGGSYDGLPGHPDVRCDGVCPVQPRPVYPRTPVVADRGAALFRRNLRYVPAHGPELSGILL